MSLQLDVWSDYVCPFCYLEEPILNRMREEFGDQLIVRWRAFELRPEPVPTLPPHGDYLVNIWDRAVYPMARERGMNLKLPPVQPRSRRALEAAEFARDEGKFDPMHAAIFRAFFEEGSDIGEMETLLELGEKCGLERSALEQALTSGEFRARVLADEELSQELGVSGVPAMLLRRDDEPLQAARSLSGAQPEFMVRAAIQHLLQNPA
ncbi:MAG: DsbA family oxidoreductase [Chthoniobacterales bacterium]